MGTREITENTFCEGKSFPALAGLPAGWAEKAVASASERDWSRHQQAPAGCVSGLGSRQGHSLA